MFDKQKAWARQYILLNNAHHVAAGFGLALLLQHYLIGSAFAPVAVGVVLIGFSVAVHIYAWTRP